MLLEGLFGQIAVVIVVAAALSFIMHRLRQPLIIAYLVAGVLVGPELLRVVQSADFFQTLSDIGIAFLLFTVGLNLNWKHIKEVGWVALATGLSQVAITSGTGYLLAWSLGFPHITSLYIGVAFCFSSTIIIVKLLSDKEDLEALYGRIAVGFLIVQDLIAMLLLLFLSAITSGGSLAEVAGMVIGKWFVALVGTAVLSRWILPPLVRYAARSQELLFLFGLAWCFGIASLLFLVGFGIETGALLAGVSLAGMLWTKELTSRIRPLRDFFLVIFFIVLGTHLTIGAVATVLLPALLFSSFILIGNPLIVMIILRVMGYHPRTGFLAGTTVAQISEFSFILLATGLGAGHVNTNVLTMATLVGLITIAASSYLITYNDQIYDKLAPLFRWLEPGRQERHLSGKMENVDVVLFGYHRMGEVILPKIKALKKKYLVVDFDPFMIERLKHQRVPHVYGDAGDPNFLAELNVRQASLVVSTIPDEEISLDLVEYMRNVSSKAPVIVTVKTPEQAEHLYHAGATFVIIPSVLGGERFGELLLKQKTDRKNWDQLSRVFQKLKG